MSGLTTEDLACRKGIRTQDLGPGLQMPGRKKKMGVGRIIRWRLLTGLAFGVKILVGEDPV